MLYPQPPTSFAIIHRISPSPLSLHLLPDPLPPILILVLKEAIPNTTFPRRRLPPLTRNRSPNIRLTPRSLLNRLRTRRRSEGLEHGPTLRSIRGGRLNETLVMGLKRRFFSGSLDL